MTSKDKIEQELATAVLQILLRNGVVTGYPYKFKKAKIEFKYLCNHDALIEDVVIKGLDKYIKSCGLNPLRYHLSDRLRVTNRIFIHYGKIGVVVAKGERGGYYLKFEDRDSPVYIPFGFEKV